MFARSRGADGRRRVDAALLGNGRRDSRRMDPPRGHAEPPAEPVPAGSFVRVVVRCVPLAVPSGCRLRRLGPPEIGIRAPQADPPSSPHRIRPFNDAEQRRGDPRAIHALDDGRTLSVSPPGLGQGPGTLTDPAASAGKRVVAYDAVHGEEHSQEQVFENCGVTEVIDQALQGSVLPFCPPKALSAVDSNHSHERERDRERQKETCVTPRLVPKLQGICARANAGRMGCPRCCYSNSLVNGARRSGRLG
jgi:hypothetical protein